MQVQILEIILWPKNEKFVPRRVAFQPGMVNVISGASKTGKSSVIPIIDYCLGSDRCAVPVRTIRNACAWFGIMIQTAEGKKLLARREPGAQQSTGDMYLLEGADIDVPNVISEKNTTVDAVKRLLDRMAGLSNLGFDPAETGNGFKARPSFRDLLAFCFQPQNIVANPDVLFFRADTNEHREKLRTIFPYVLGATTADLLAKQWELDKLQKELKRKERELAAQIQASDSWKAGLLNWVTEASELGLVENCEYANLGEAQLIALLEKVVLMHSGEARSPFPGLEASSEAYVNLQREESEISLALSVAKRRLDQISAIKGGVSAYSNGLSSQRDRLGISRWLRGLGKSAEVHNCPICKGPMGDAHSDLDRLCDSIATLESEITQVVPAPAALDRELVTVKEELRQSADRLKGVRIRRRAMEERSKAINEARTTSSNIDRFLGRAEQALKMFVARTVESGIKNEVDVLREQVSTLRREIQQAAQQRRLEAALGKISNLMGQITTGLDAEQPDDPAKLDIKELTVTVGNADGRSDYLWEMGSGANWLSYHVSATLALQRFFLEQTETAVPSILLYDQPSQVYFPRRLAAAEDDAVGGEGEEVKLRDEDIVAIRRFFSTFGEATSKANGKLQVIVLDHADGEVWGNIRGVTLVEEWRNNNKLVPMEWLAAV